MKVFDMGKNLSKHQPYLSVILPDPLLDEIIDEVLKQLHFLSLSLLLFGIPVNDEERKLLADYERAKKETQ